MALKGMLNRYRKQALDIIFEETPELNRWERGLRYVLRFGMHTAKKLIEDGCGQRAASLAYTTLLSLIPATALMVSYFKVAGSLDRFSTTLQEWILNLFVADSAFEVVRYIEQFVANLHTGTLGTIGIIGMLTVSYSLFRTVEVAFNDIWELRTRRSIFQRFQILFSFLVVVPTLLVSSFYVTGKVQGLKWFDRYDELTYMVRTLLFALPFMLTTIPLFLIYKWVPHTTVRWKPAIIAAFITAFLFECAKAGFNIYVLKVLTVHKVYGSLGLLPIFLIWIYVSWIVVLFGVEISYTIQNLSSLQEEAEMQRRPNPFALPLHEEWGMKIFQAFLDHFQGGEGAVSSETLADELGIHQKHIDDHLRVLVDAQLLLYIEETMKFLPAKPLDQISLEDVANLYREKLGLPPRQYASQKGGHVVSPSG